MCGNSNFLLVLLVIGTSLATVNCQVFVTHFLCANPVNTMYVSAPMWGLQAYRSAATLCGSRRVVNDADLNQQCLQTYLSHIANSTTGPQTFWVNSTVTPCYPAVSSCPSTARVICYGTIIAGTMQCPTQSITNGLAVAPSGRYFPSSVIFSCNPGYTLSGYPVRNCLSTGVWTGPAPTCHAIQCQDAPIIPNGYILAMNYVAGNVPTVNCNTGYSRSSATTPLLCSSTGSWTGNPAGHCTINTCPMLSAPSSGTISAFTTTPYSIVTFGCNTGYTSTGDNAAVCQADGTWSTPVPTCSTIQCQSLPTIANSAMYPSQSLLTRGSIVFVTCNSGYQLVGNNSISCQSDLSWTSTSCSPNMCSPLPTIAGATVTASQSPLVPGSVAFVTCNTGFTAISGNVITCQPNKSWSLVTCSGITCPALTAPQNGAVAGGIAGQGQTRTFSCDAGYQISGQATVQCQVTSAWSAPSPTCTKIPTCQALTIPNGNLSSTGTTTFTEISCDIGYQLEGDSSIFCKSSGEWSYPNPTCAEITAGGTTGATTTTVHTEGSQLTGDAQPLLVYGGVGFAIGFVPIVGALVFYCLRSKQRKSQPTLNPSSPVVAASPEALSSNIEMNSMTDNDAYGFGGSPQPAVTTNTQIMINKDAYGGGSPPQPPDPTYTQVAAEPEPQYAAIPR